MTTEPAPRVCSFESRRSAEMRALIEKHGGQATVVASMQEVPLEANGDATAFAEKLCLGDVDFVVFLTGVGATALLAAVETAMPREQFLEALRRTTTVVRGPKPARVLADWDVPADYRVAEPNTWQEVLQLIDRENLSISDSCVAVQEYGVANDAFYKALGDRGARVLPVPVYRWQLPDDPKPLHGAVATTIAGHFDVLLFTSAQQVRNVLAVAGETAADWIRAAQRCCVGSVGPTCSVALRDVGLRVDFEADPPKMGPLVRGALKAWRSQ